MAIEQALTSPKKFSQLPVNIIRGLSPQEVVLGPAEQTIVAAVADAFQSLLEGGNKDTNSVKQINVEKRTHKLEITVRYVAEDGTNHILEASVTPARTHFKREQLLVDLTAELNRYQAVAAEFQELDNMSDEEFAALAESDEALNDYQQKGAALEEEEQALKQKLENLSSAVRRFEDSIDRVYDPAYVHRNHVIYAVDQNNNFHFLASRNDLTLISLFGAEALGRDIAPADIFNDPQRNELLAKIYSNYLPAGISDEQLKEYIIQASKDREPEEYYAKLGPVDRILIENSDTWGAVHIYDRQIQPNGQPAPSFQEMMGNLNSAFAAMKP